MEQEDKPSQDDLSERLAAARKKEGLDKDKKINDSSLSSKEMSVLAFTLRLATEMVSALVVGVAIGWALDHWLKTRMVFLILFSFLGTAAGVLNVWRVSAKADKN